MAAEAITKIDDAVEKGYLLLERITPRRFEKAKRLRLKYQDKCLISDFFYRFNSVVVMSEKEIETILTEDVHFTYLEGGFEKVP